MQQVIVNVSDFKDDYYHGVMNGVILSNLDDSRNVHFVNLELSQKFNVISTAWALKNSRNYFPKNTVFLVVVDPGVGTERKPIIVVTNEQYFVLPDNGIISPLLEKDWRAWEITKYDKYSKTFHGRDIFAPTVAEIINMIESDNLDFSQIGREIDKLEEIQLEITNEGSPGKVVYIDIFGNIVTNIRPSRIDFGDEFLVKINNERIKIKLFENFENSENQTLFAIIGSCNTLELVKRQSSASNHYPTINIGDPFEIIMIE